MKERGSGRRKRGRKAKQGGRIMVEGRARSEREDRRRGRGRKEEGRRQNERGRGTQE